MSRRVDRRSAPALVALESRTTPALFAAGSTFPALGTAPGGQYALNGLVAGDFNNDGVGDVVAVNSRAGTFQVFLNDRTGQFTPGVALTHPASGLPTAAVAADLNADGKLDLVTTFVDLTPGGSAGDAVVVWLGNGDGTFAAAPTGPGGPPQLEAWDAAAADFTGDGKPDLAVVSPDGVTGFGQGGYAVLAGNGDGTFTAIADAASAQFAGSTGVFAADFDGDGKTDFASAGSPAGGGAQVVFGAGNGTAAAVATLPAPPGLSGGGTIASAASADFTGDGRPDLVVAYQNNEFYLFANNGGRQFADPVLKYTGPGNAFDMRARDFNQDGKADVALAEMDALLTSGHVTALLGDGAGAFAAAAGSPFAAAGGAYKAAVGEFTGGGAPDVLVGNYSTDTLQLFRNTTSRATPVAQFAVGADRGGGAAALYNPDGGKRFTVEAFAGFAGGVRTAAADFTGDGVADLVVGTGPGAETLVRVLDGVDQSELFAVRPFESSFTGGVYVAAGDLDGDGTPDLAISPDEGGGPRVRVFSGKGFGQLADFLGIEDPNFRGGARAAIGDVNGDGAGDLIVAAGFAGGPRVAGFSGRSLAGGPVKLFADFLTFEPALRNGSYVAAGDVDGDGFAEVVAGGGPGGGPRVTAFSGKALLGNQQTVLADFFAGDVSNRGGVRLAVKDLDGDGRADLVTGAGTGAGSRVTAYPGKGMGSGAAPALDFEAFPGFSGGVFVG